MLMQRLLASAGGEEKLYSDDVFQAYTRTGTDSAATVTTGISLSTKGGMIWSKGRSGATDHAIYDTARGATFDLASNLTSAQTIQSQGLTAFGATGHTWGTLAKVNTNAATYVDYVFAKAPKFFDVVTYTGNGVAGRQIPHSLGVAPGMVIVKSTSMSGTDWVVFHRSCPLPAGTTGIPSLKLNTTESAISTETGGYYWNDTPPTSTNFTVETRAAVNASGATYVAYLFAHDTASDGLIQCGSYVGNGSTAGPTITLGWEPQWVLIKNVSGAANWYVIDSMRGMPVGSADATLNANNANSESTSIDCLSPTSRGFQITSTNAEINNNGQTFIYLAIRRPNKPPTSGTEVFAATVQTSTAGDNLVSAGFPSDTIIRLLRSTALGKLFGARLTGSPRLDSTNTNAESADFPWKWDTQVGAIDGSASSGFPAVYYNLKRAPGFFDVVCYSGDSTGDRLINHNLQAVPEMIIVKRRTSSQEWYVYSNTAGNSYFLFLNTVASVQGPGATQWGTTNPTQSNFRVGGVLNSGGIPDNYVAYLFASLPGISKVGSYTGNGTSQTIPCGFTTGARFFLVKATSTTGSWWVFDSVRGVISAADPALQLNSTAAEVTSADAVDPASVGIVVNQEATCSINANGVSYIYLAIA